MTVHFYDDAHEAFFREKLKQAAASGRTSDSYFQSLIYLCGLCADTRDHFPCLFDWWEWCICPEALTDGWQTGTSKKITRLAFNLWNGYGQEQPEDERVSMAFLPDEIFCCGFQSYFFEAVRLRFPEYAGAGSVLSSMEPRWFVQ